MSSVRWRGVIRDKTDKFRSLKDGGTTQASGSSGNSRELRFKRLNNSFFNLADDEDDLEQPPIKQNINEPEVSISSGDQTLEDDGGIDVRDRKHENMDDTSDVYQPPFWVLWKDEIDENMKQIEIKFEKLKLMERRRVNEIFKKGEVDDVQYLVEEITQDLRVSEGKLRDIRKYESTSEADEKIKTNVEIVVAKKLQDLTHSLRQRQRKYVGKHTLLFYYKQNNFILSNLVLILLFSQTKRATWRRKV
jgi:hypothetical protein